MRRIAFAAAAVYLAGLLSSRAAAAPPPGRALYVAECAGCHGINGDGKGQADPALSPPPRDFTRGKFKFRTTDAQKPITDDELLQTITNGVAGTAMPSFRYLSMKDRQELVRYVRYLAHLEGQEGGAPITIPDPPAVTPELVAEGEKLYANLGCPACHGPAGGGDGPAASALKDEWGAADPAPDLTQSPYRGGDSLKDVFLRLTVGVPGTPMPGYASVTGPEQRWAVAAYLQSIRRPPPNPPTDPAKLGEFVIAQYHCLACHQLKGKGGTVGPPLDLVALKLRPEWLQAYLANPRLQPKVYPSYAQRMPQLFLKPNEVEGVMRYLSSLAKTSGQPKETKPVAAATPQLPQGEAIFMSQCLPCHALGPHVTRLPRQPVGPDLSRAPARLQYEWVLTWPNVHAGVRADVPKLSDADVRAVAAFVWNVKR